MAAVTKKLDWSEETDAFDLPQLTRTTDADGTITEVSYRVEDGKKLRTTRKIRIVRALERVSHAEAQRKQWKKFGAEKGKSAGPQSDTTSVGENIKVKLTQGYSTYAAKQAEIAAESEEKALKSSLSSASVKCRICTGDHYTARCPYKETLKPLDGGDVDPAAKVMEEVDNGTGAGSSNGKYVPVFMRAGNKGTGETMNGVRGPGGRDELPTLRITNLSEDAEEEDLKALFGRHGAVARVFLARDKDTRRVKGFAFISFYDRADAEKAQQRMDGFGYDNLILHVEFTKPRDE
ncbi:eukaryotic translation initiation factor 3 subunit G-domain-containing protein [Protomyces lactucae-debilis]|uniref:Eukaryotic translation initiation factor 3 subunit G n=1 Tax=Protomyces lactucae-debilis TaxID=2754530 RepID=A0A1Y2FH89_PROLT|nr:eukaryotic translation initiation factor 3 subunit G-domain-containing protein [Protomyces lactucae-debilis]ORY83310.1 eukaryotic translation initiation factor 3 subunit G-domain-containing protein [Protomyces lactucae-debilis]